VSQLDLAPGRRLLDVGCGLGGAARYCARTHGCTVTGVDLSEEYVRTAERLTARVGLESLVSFRQASARALPFEAGTFDVVTMLHVGMNVRDKAALFGEIRRVLAPGGELGVYDVLRESDGEAIPYPMPWATSAETSFVGTEATYRSALEQAGFEVRTCRSRRESAIEFFQRMRAQAQASGGPPRLGLHVLMGPSAPQKIANMIDAVERRLIAPTAIVARSKA
jgi:ubiquinone/menaquinone biosynthesis C-methylase UbiE